MVSLGNGGGIGGAIVGAAVVAAGVIAAGWVCRICPNCCTICGDHEKMCPHCRCGLRCPNCNNKCGKQSACANCGVALHGGWGYTG